MYVCICVYPMGSIPVENSDGYKRQLTSLGHLLCFRNHFYQVTYINSFEEVKLHTATTQKIQIYIFQLLLTTDPLVISHAPSLMLHEVVTDHKCYFCPGGGVQTQQQANE